MQNMQATWKPSTENGGWSVSFDGLGQVETHAVCDENGKIVAFAVDHCESLDEPLNTEHVALIAQAPAMLNLLKKASQTLAALNGGELAASVGREIEDTIALIEAGGVPTPAQPHFDDLVVDQFAANLKAKLARQRAKGHGDWHDKQKCPDGRLQQMLIDHIAKGDPVDVANFAMFLWHRGESTLVPAQPKVDAQATGEGRNDPMYETAVQIVQSNQKASISLVQRHLRISYNRATSLLEAMVGTVVDRQGDTGLYQLISTGK